MLQTKNIEALTRTSFVALSPQVYNAPEHETKNNLNDSGSSNVMADKPIEPTGRPASNSAGASVGVSGSTGNRELDQALVERAQQGDKKAFGMLVEKYHRKLGRLLGRDRKSVV